MNLIEGIQEELKRCQELKTVYEPIGPAGFFGLSVVNQSITKAEKAVASGDVTEMLRAYRDLKERE